MQPARHSPVDALRIADRLRKRAAVKWGGASSHRRVMTPGSERGLVAIMGPDCLYYANTVGASGVVSAGQNWDRLASAVRRWDLKLAESKEAPILLFSDDALFLAEDEIFEGSVLVIIPP